MLLAELVTLGAVADFAGPDLGFAAWICLDAGAAGVLAVACLGGAGLGPFGEGFLEALPSLTTARAIAFLAELEGLLDGAAALSLLPDFLPEVHAAALGFSMTLGSAAVAVGVCDSLLRFAAAATGPGQSDPGTGLLAACTLLMLVVAVADVLAVPAAPDPVAPFCFLQAGSCAIDTGAVRFAERGLSAERDCPSAEWGSPLAGRFCPLSERICPPDRGLCQAATGCCPCLVLPEGCGLPASLLPSACAWVDAAVAA